jgi:cytochrome c-type biogenesis protein CcmH
MTGVLRGISRLLCAALAVLLVSGPAHAVDPIELADPALQERYRALSHELRCMQCQNQSIADSPVGLAGDLRREVRELLVAGKTDAEVRSFMQERYGDFILFRPAFTARTAWLWAAPVVLLALGLFVAVRVIRKRAAVVDEDDVVAGEEGASR